MKTRLFSRIDRRIPLVLSIIAMLLFTTNVLAASGALDPTFGTNGIVTADLGSPSDSARSVALQSDGKIVLLGFAPSQVPIVMRYNSNGSVDNTFGFNGQLDVGFGQSIAVQPDGKLLVAGSSNGGLAVARYNSTGTSLDTSFGNGGVAIFASTPGWDSYSFGDLALQSDGKIALVGTQTNQGNFINIVVGRFNSDGTPYETDFSGGLIILDHDNFPNSRYSYGQAVAIQSDGKVVVSGGMMDEDADGQISLVRFNADSSIDTSTFGTNGKGTATAAVLGFHQHKSSMVLQADGKIVVTGTASDNDDLHNDLIVARFNGSGALDTTFGGTGIVTTDFGANEFGVDLNLQSDGKIVVVGASSSTDPNLLIVRYNPNGSLDSTFGDSGKLIGGLGSGPSSGAGIKIQPDGKIVVTGSSNGNAFLARYLQVTPTATTVTYRSVGAYDGWILESAENSNSGGTFDRLATTMNIGDDAKDKQYRGILSFNTASLPDNAVITSVQLNVRKQGLVGTDPLTTHGDLLVDIRNSAFSNNLVLQTADFAAAASPGSVQEKLLLATSNWYRVNLNSTNLNFISKIGLTQFRLLFALDDNDDLGADYLKFFTGNTTAANQPQLIITYFKP